MNKKNKSNWKLSILPPSSTIKEVIKNLNITNLQITLIAKKKKLLGTVTDGDIRRGLLAGCTLKDNVQKIMNKKVITVNQNTNLSLVKETMKLKSILQIPIVTKQKKIIGLHFWNKSVDQEKRNNPVVIMAGGFGKRMKKKTSFTPKPMILLYGKPILEHIINNLKQSGFTNIIITTHYLEHKIRDYFKDGKKLGVKIKYIKERKPLGTAGSLSRLSYQKNNVILVTNGDVISNINYSEFLHYHNKNKSQATMAVREIKSQNSFGVVESNGFLIDKIKEKPISKVFINAGIYAFNKNLFKLIPKNNYLNMTDFFNQLILKKNKAIIFPLYEHWQDFAKPKDLKISKKKFKL